MALLVDQEQLPPFVALVAGTDESSRAPAAEALNLACQRILAKRGRLDASSLVSQLKTGAIQSRVALLPVCSGLIDPEIRTALRTAIADPGPELRSADGRMG